MKKIVYVMRGVPGSGKSTRARQLAGDVGAIHSTDNFFYVGGEFRFVPSKLGTYHKLNFLAFRASLCVSISPVVCDNTNVTRREFAWYVAEAEKWGYEVVEVAMPHLAPEVAALRSTKDVPVPTIERMLERWEE